MQPHNTAQPRGKRTWRCEKCDYDLRGTWYQGMTKCPECGSDVNYRNHFRRILRWVALAATLVVPILLIPIGVWGRIPIFLPETSTWPGVTMYVGIGSAPLAGALLTMQLCNLNLLRWKRHRWLKYAATTAIGAIVIVGNGMALYVLIGVLRSGL